MSPEELYRRYRGDPNQDMYEYSPLLRFRAKGNVVEIGVRGGVSTAALLLGVEEHGGHVYSVDINPDCGKLFSHPQWTFIHADSVKDSSRLRLALPQIDVLLIDGDHRYSALKSDLETYAPLVKRGGGLILVHDIIPAVPERMTDDLYPTEETRLAYQEFAIKFGRPHFELPGQFGMGMIYP